ncbi:hypothetical protein F5Y09DRAFT_306286 [Xylaria sp. FL1042]|nr:hypothetical protein F5Y09DRAFT_306286 [Xylaria sp. FL1042]
MERREFSDDNGAKREGKGKGKEEERVNEQPDRSSSILPAESSSSNNTDSRSHSGTTLSRLASSAASLTGGFTSGRAHGQPSLNILPSGKAESSSVSQQPQAVLQETARITHISSQNVRLPLGTTFRSEAGQDRESSEKGFSEFLETTQDARVRLGESNPNRNISHVEAAAMNDGSDVVDLLETGLVLEADDDDVPYMTNDELSTLRRALFGEGPPTGTGWNEVLDFVPEFISHHGNDEQLAQHLGVSNAVEARDIWFNQWGIVLSSYTDEVWGDLGPLVTAARQELQRASTTPEGATANSLHAVRRLQQILAHVRGSS